MFFADQGIFRSGDYFQIMNRASCLSLLSNVVLVYNTLRMIQVLERAKAQGQEFTPEEIAHISPLAYRHVIVNGTYDFSPPQTSDTQDQLCVKYVRDSFCTNLVCTPNGMKVRGQLRVRTGLT